MKVSLLFTLMLLLPLSLFSNSDISQERLVELFRKIDLKTTSTNGLTIIHNDGSSKVTLSPNREDISIETTLKISNKNEKTLLKQINSFNKNLLFAKVYLEKNTLTLHSDLSTKHQTSDIKMVNFIATFLAIRETFIAHFKPLKD